ncbi:MAG: glycosyltransferase [Terracidiphilus sp.]
MAELLTMTTESPHGIEVALLTGGGDRPYAYGLVKALMSNATCLDVIGNDELDCAEFRNAPSVRFLNLRGDQRPDVSFTSKALRVLKYYARLIAYTATAKPKLFHILWNNKFEYFDRTLLMLWYRVLGKRIVLTLHNVNGRKRDCTDSTLNRVTLRIQYRLADHLFVHTEKMKQELLEEFGVGSKKVTVIPFGINNAVPDTQITGKEARQKLGFTDKEKIILFFGNIAPYKGLEYLVEAFHRITRERDDYRLVIAGRPKNCEDYWKQLQSEIANDVLNGRVLLRDEYVPDEDTELYMKAADVLVLPYRHIYQSGVLFLGYSFGLPVLAADVGSLREEIVKGKTGFVFRPEDPQDLAHAIDRYFTSGLYIDLDNRRREIKDYAKGRNSWIIVGQMTMDVYCSLIQRTSRNADGTTRISSAVDAKINDRCAG